MSKERIRREGSPLRSDAHSVKVYVPRFKYQKPKCDLDFRFLELGIYNPNVREKVIVFLGETGSGKTTLINALLNYILGVKWKDDFRFCIPIDDGEQRASSNTTQGQTQYLTVYKIHHQTGFRVPFTVSILDTPGFNDPNGLQRDQQITKLLATCFEKSNRFGIPHINGLCIVLKAGTTRLTPTEKYVLKSVLDTFGNDLRDNLNLTLTFSDGSSPTAAGVVRSFGVDVDRERVFIFNNSSLYVHKNARNASICEQIWNMGQKNIAAFFAKLLSSQNGNLEQTQEVIRHRRAINDLLKSLQRDVYDGLEQVGHLKQELQKIKELRREIDENKDFTYEEHKVELKETENEHGVWALNCTNCRKTCHIPCTSLFVYMCTMFYWSGGCRICQNNCDSGSHVFATKHYDKVPVTKTRTNQNMREKFDSASSRLSRSQMLIRNKGRAVAELQLALVKPCFTYKNYLESCSRSRCMIDH
jgi:GTPase SAR1 family protein